MEASGVFFLCLLLHGTEGKIAWIDQENEPQCAIFSRFDYELKVVQKLGEFENLYKEQTKVNEEQKKTNEDLRTELRNIKEGMKDHHLDTFPDTVVAFLAVLDASISIGSNQIIVFERVITNIGQAYSSQTGVFTAPVDGIFLFTTTLLTENNKEIWCYVMLNGKDVARINERGTDGRHGSGSQTVILQLNEGDEVDVRNSKYLFALQGGAYGSFAGFLIKEQK